MRVHVPLAVALLLVALPACATLVEVTPNGFAVRHEVTLAAPPDAAWRTLLDVARWWNPDHTFSGSAANLSIDARPGGCFCEKLADGGGVEHLRVVYLAPGRQLRMAGALGPLQGSGLAGSMTWQFAEAPGGARLVLTYSVGGYMQGGFEKIAPAVDRVLGEQVQRLKAAVDATTGDPPRKAP
jgi:uncharacterized protein YndB with AHSA1/START domain